MAIPFFVFRTRNVYVIVVFRRHTVLHGLRPFVFLERGMFMY